MKKFIFLLLYLCFAMALSCTATERGASINRLIATTPNISPNQTELQQQNATVMPGKPREASIKQKLQSWKIDYEISGGFAGIQRKMELSNDGKLIATDLKQKRTVEQQVSEEQLTKIASILVTIDYQQGTNARSKLSNRCADCFLHNITLIIDGQQQTIAGNDISLRNSPYTSLIGLLSSLLDAALVNKNIER